MGFPIDAWATCPQPKAGARLRLFFFPFAGGGAAAYRPFCAALPGDIEPWLIHLPGREQRMREQPFSRASTLVAALADAIEAPLDAPFAFFGHSMGARLAFELARERRRRKKPGPSHLLVSGRRAPHTREPVPPLHSLPEAELITVIRRMGGTPDAVLREPELLALLLPGIRADLAVNEVEPFVPAPPLSCPIAAFGGVDDERATTIELDAWREHTTGAFTRELLPGGHFFLLTERAAMLRAIERALSP